MWKIQRLIFSILALPSTGVVPSTALRFPVPFPALSSCLSCSLIVGYFLYGTVGMYGERRLFFPDLRSQLSSHC